MVQERRPPQIRRLGVTSREMDVFLLVARGFSNAEIAARLFISPKTVETHVANLVAKTGQSGRRYRYFLPADDVSAASKTTLLTLADSALPR